MRVAIAAESFLPQVNGVTNSVLRVCEHLQDKGHEALIIAPSATDIPETYAGFPVTTVPSVSFPMYQDVKVALTPSFVMDRILLDFAPDVLHAAGPFMIGAGALDAAARLAIPSVAIYQTDIPSFASHYGLSLAENLAWSRVRDIHSLANLTLAPSTFARDQLLDHDVPRVSIWGRGVDTDRFTPDKRDLRLHNEWAPDGEVVIGYMGRLAAEKRVGDLHVLADIPGTRMVVVGGGPSRKAFKKRLPNALFLGKKEGEGLAQALATMDIFVHPGELETFCQAIQEALASGLPVLAPAKGGPIDLVQSDRTGYLYPPGDLDVLRNHAEELAVDEEKRMRFSLEARQFTAMRTWPVICDQLLGHYERVIQEASRTHRDGR